jgi:hypothetical protein
MTFTEAAIEVLRREGKPLHFRKITEIAVRESLLDHVGKIPEEVMADQVAAHCRLPRTERRLLPVLPGTFGLVEWGLDEDPQGLENLIEPPPIDDVPYRARERHPAPMRDAGRASGRGEKGRRREEGDERHHGRRFPPPAEVAYEILAGAGEPLTLTAIAAQGAERLLMPDAFVRDAGALASALQEDNRRRESAGRRALFALDGELVRLAAQPEPGERVAAVVPVGRTSPADLRRAGLAALRRRLRECDAATVEHAVGALLAKLGYRELKVAKRGREHVIYTGRRRLGLSDVRHCFRVVRSGAEAGRRDVLDTRRDLGHYGAQVGVVVTAGEAARDARSEATAGGQLPVLLLCGEALAEAFAEAGLGCVTIQVPDLDEAWFAAATEAAALEESSRRARREERDRRDGERHDRTERPDRAERPDRHDERSAEGSVPAAVAEVTAPTGGEPADGAEPPGAMAGSRSETAEEPEGPDDDGPDDGDEGDEEEEREASGEVAPGAPGAEAKPGVDGARRRRRRRRRRGGRGRGERREGAPQEAGAPPTGGPGATSAGEPPPAPRPPEGGGPSEA